ncbi:MAG: SDR family oxidoreductase [Balneolaceae bacterium]|nr:MAG: SDR family oxidoreductase [Balneolaceae bacterium]
MDDKISIVTGANSGIGKETARALLREGYRVVMVCRSKEKAAAARKELIKETGNEKADILLCNLDSMQHVADCANHIKNNYSRIDLLVNNAGILPDGERTLTDEGLEYTFAVNHMAYFLMTRELLPLLKRTPGSRVINVASDAHNAGEFNPGNIQLEKGYSTMKAYGNSKLFNIMFTWQLAKELKGSGTTTFSLHPGVVNTNFASNSNSWFAKLFNIGRIFMISPEKGAKTSIYLCTEEGIEQHSGKYFKNSALSKPGKSEAHDDDACRELWEISEGLLGKVIPQSVAE